MTRPRAREGRGGDAVVEKLRRDNKKLRRKIERLEKQVKQGGEPPEPVDDDDDEAPPLPSGGPPRCPLCGSVKLGSYRTPGGKTRVGCKSCKKWRG